MPQSRPNVRQHVVPQVYLEQFGDADGTLQIQDVASGRVFPGRPPDLCVEKEVYTLLHDQKRDDSCDKINNEVEGAIGAFYNRLESGVNLADEQTRREIFTTLAVFTANLIARSRVLRDHLNNSLDAINQFLAKHPDFLDEFPEDKYQEFLQNPESVKGSSKIAQVLRKFAQLLRYSNEARTEPCTVATTIESLKQLIKIHYPVLLRPRTAILPEIMQRARVRGDLLVPESGRFISADDPVIFIVNGELATNLNPTDLQVWAATNRSVYLPLRPDLAVHWTVNGSFVQRTVAREEVECLNRLVAANAIRQRFARVATDFPT